MPLEMKYFVLKPKGPTPFAIASRMAMDAYAASIRRTDPDLAQGLVSWVDREREAVYGS